MRSRFLSRECRENEILQLSTRKGDRKPKVPAEHNTGRVDEPKSSGHVESTAKLSEELAVKNAYDVIVIGAGHNGLACAAY